MSTEMALERRINKMECVDPEKCTSCNSTCYHRRHNCTSTRAKNYIIFARCVSKIKLTKRTKILFSLYLPSSVPLSRIILASTTSSFKPIFRRFQAHAIDHPLKLIRHFSSRVL